MKGKYREKLLVLFSSLVLSAAVVLCIVFVSEAGWEDARIVAVTCIFLGLWAFGFIPAYLYAFRKEAERLAQMPPQEAARQGYMLGLLLKGLLFILPLLLAPGLAFFYYFGRT